MKKWTDTAIQRSIDDLIEESYLMTLSEDTIREYLSSFVKACESVIKESSDIHGDIRLTKVKITLLRSYLYLNRKISVADKKSADSEDISRQTELFAHNVIKIKSTTLRLLDSIDRTYTISVLKEEQMQRNKISSGSERTVKRRLLHESLYFILLFTTVSLLVATILL